MFDVSYCYHVCLHVQCVSHFFYLSEYCFIHLYILLHGME